MTNQTKKYGRKRFLVKLITLTFLVLISRKLMVPDKIVSRQLLAVEIGCLVIEKVDAYEIKVPPEQRKAPQKHRCPAGGHVVSGSVLFQVKTDALKTLKAGSVVFEPADAQIFHFDKHDILLNPY